MADIALRQVNKAFGQVQVIKGVDLEIKSNEFVVFVGPSGCGKWTLLRLVAGLEDITSGEMWIDNQRVNDLPPAQRGIAMVFQSYALYPHMSVYENMAFGLKRAKHGAAVIEEKVLAAAKILQLEPLLKRKPSGGQRQRVAIGRAIVRDPKVFLFDEPLSNLDAALRVQMRIEIAKLHHDLSATMIYVTHDQVEAMTLADRIVVLNGGLVEQFGSPLDLYHNPDNLFVAGFIGSPKMNFLPAQITDGNEAGTTVRLSDGGSITIPAKANNGGAGGACTLGVRPEHLVEGGGGAASLRGEAIAVERLGGETYIYLDIGQDELLVVKAVGDSSTKFKDNVEVGIPLEACYLFDGDGKACKRLGSP
jgi:multiple sugar transport system ATP-binding protein